MCTSKKSTNFEEKNGWAMQKILENLKDLMYVIWARASVVCMKK